MRHVHEPSRYHGTLGPHPAALRITPGDTVVTACLDADGRDRDGHQVVELDNPMTGPFHVEGAEPGDALQVRFERISPIRAVARSATAIAATALDPADRQSQPVGGTAEWDLDVAAGTATLRAPTMRLAGLTLPLAPMLGCFGVAPPGGQAISTATAGPHGGNMDYRAFAAGVTAELPVFVAGAFFFLGDGHALQGDGEIAGSGLEVPVEVEFSVTLRKDAAIRWPRGETRDHVFTVGCARPLDQALQHATSEMLRLLTAEHDLDARDAQLLLGQAAMYDVANVFNPAFSVACKLAKRLLPPRALDPTSDVNRLSDFDHRRRQL
jgi:acetamidase/formamidase